VVKIYPVSYLVYFQERVAKLTKNISPSHYFVMDPDIALNLGPKTQ